MLAHWWITTCWVPWAICASAWTQRTGGEDQQPTCLARDWREVEAGSLQWPVCIETRWDHKTTGEPASPTPKATVEPSSITFSVDTAQPSPPGREADQELDTDSPLDNANFLSFEDWKKQNLAKAGQSAENVGGNRRAGAAGKDRRRPTRINNALDSLGEDGEIELDFGVFGADPSEATKPAPSWGAHVLPGGDGAVQNHHADGDSAADAAGQGVPPAGGPRSKDAGTTCKERFNYASFDCAATVLKTNPQAKGSSAVLIENKDSYMLNECRAENKFLILELCDDILVDTVVLANYEFFSSIFHTFRVSVSDRYPAKPDQWKELGVYEARNTREVQAFAVTNPLIWARYLRIEFLTHYGHEWFCPLSLIRVHGTTMLEEYKHDGEANRAEEEIAEEVPESAPEAKPTTEAEDIPPPASPPVPRYAGNVEIASFVSGACPNLEAAIQLTLLRLWGLNTCSLRDTPLERTATAGSAAAPDQASLGTGIRSIGDIAVADVASPVTGDTKTPTVDASAQSSADDASTAATSDVAPQNATSEPDPRSSGVSRDEQGANSTRATATQPPAANPTTQESFFKSVNKRLQMLETNSSLSLQYIEEQSRILRDAFNKVEKRQLAKTTTFLENLNVTVVGELKQFREQYDQAWRSVALEFEHQRIQYHQEILSINNQLGVLADELVFQKRVAVVQSIMVLICFALVLFTHGTVGGYIEFPSVQNMVSRSYSLRSPSPLFGSAPGSPSSPRQASSYRRLTSHRRQISDDSQGGSLSPTIAYAPPTPTSDDSSLQPETRDPPRLTAAPQLHRSNSSPADLKGEENEGEDDEKGSDGLESESECSDTERP
ncbi:UNC-like C-terminal-domain-containing protein [Aspergillus granulosus]|uniref:UNC-like C-terminal-domain-containing protein n=1 Tax=Aspergillus granulosus TaxID=176169 RepID=A0ABR4HHI2_9EURO